MKSQEELVLLVDRKFGTTLDRSIILKILKSRFKIINNANGLFIKRARSRSIIFPDVCVELS